MARGGVWPALQCGLSPGLYSDQSRNTAGATATGGLRNKNVVHILFNYFKLTLLKFKTPERAKVFPVGGIKLK